MIKSLLRLCAILLRLRDKEYSRCVLHDSTVMDSTPVSFSFFDSDMLAGPDQTVHATMPGPVTNEPQLDSERRVDPKPSTSQVLIVLFARVATTPMTHKRFAIATRSLVQHETEAAHYPSPMTRKRGVIPLFTRR
jgi:hypothetical protein